jgi:hypothetical protein
MGCVGWGGERDVGGLIPEWAVIGVFGAKFFICIDVAGGLEEDPDLPLDGSFNEADIELQRVVSLIDISAIRVLVLAGVDDNMSLRVVIGVLCISV